MLGIVNLLALGHLEHQPLAREIEAPGGFQGGANAGFGTVDRIRQKIDAEQTVGDLVQTEVRRQFDGLDPARLIEAIAIAVVDPPEYLPADSPLSPRTSAS